jgi:hypothetical protein
MLIPDRLREVWSRADAGLLSREDAAAEQERLLDVYRARWREGLLSQGTTALPPRIMIRRVVGGVGWTNSRYVRSLGHGCH